MSVLAGSVNSVVSWVYSTLWKAEEEEISYLERRVGREVVWQMKACKSWFAWITVKSRCG